MLGTFPNCFYEAVKRFNLEDMIKDEDMKLLKANTLDLVG